MIVLVAVPKLESINSYCSHHQMVAFIFFFSHVLLSSMQKLCRRFGAAPKCLYEVFTPATTHVSNKQYKIFYEKSLEHKYSSGLKISTQISFGIASSSIEWSHRSILRKRCAKSKTKSKSISHSADAISVGIPYHIWKAWEYRKKAASSIFFSKICAAHQINDGANIVFQIRIARKFVSISIDRIL